MKDGVLINLLHFENQAPPKGVILYIHGNSKSLKHWGNHAQFFLDFGYDFICYDYRGFGKSEGKITSQNQFYSDGETVFEWVLKRYPASKIIINGYSIGSGVASYLANKYNPKKLILEAPYFNLSHIMKSNYPLIPTFILKYKFPNDEYLEKCTIPVFIFHGDKDEQINIKHSFKLSKLLKKKDRLFVLKNQFHNDLLNHQSYQKYMNEIL